jgi:hypothetical protein
MKKTQKNVSKKTGMEIGEYSYYISLKVFKNFSLKIVMLFFLLFLGYVLLSLFYMLLFVYYLCIFLMFLCCLCNWPYGCCASI